MSKLKKLIKNPELFLNDFIQKRNIDTSSISSIARTTLSKNFFNVKSKEIIDKKAPLITSNTKLFTKTIHLLHTGEGLTHGPSHLEQWIGSFIRSDDSFAILIRNKALFDWAVDKYPELSIVYARGANDVENILNKLPFLLAIYYFSNTGNLIHTLRYNRYKHIFLGHGDSDKAASAHKFFRVYDEIWVSGQAHIDRFKNSNFNVDHIKFIKIGRPNLKNILSHQLKLESKDSSKVKRIIYLPTWEGVYEENNYSSVHLSCVMLNEVLKKFNYNLSIKFHPVMGSRDKTLKALPNEVSEAFVNNREQVSVFDKTVPLDSFIGSGDAFICDISAAVSECIATLAPVFLYMPNDRKIEISNSNMNYSDYTYTFSNIEQLLGLIDSVIVKGSDPLAEMRYKALDYLLTIDATLNDEFLNQLKIISKDSTLLNNDRSRVIQ